MESKDWSGFGFFSPDLEKIKQLLVFSKILERLRGHWECGKSIFSASRAKRRM